MHEHIQDVIRQYEALIAAKNTPVRESNGIFQRYVNPVLTRDHVPPAWRYDFDEQSNPNGLERLAVNATFNSGAIFLDGTYYLVVRVEGADRKSFFALASSKSAADGFAFSHVIALPDTQPEEVNVYDMRLTKHTDGWIYGLFCSESKDPNDSDLSAAIAQTGIVRTKDFLLWERLPNMVSRSPQQRNVVLFPEKINGQYAFLTRPQDAFISAGAQGGICFAVCDDITNAVIVEETPVSPRRYHTITESKNGAGATPIKTEKGWLHIAHGVRNTAAGLRYVLYVFVTDLNDPAKVIASPAGCFLTPRGAERVGDVSNVVFTNGVCVDEKTGDTAIYYASSDTRLHVATTTLDLLLDYAFNTPSDGLRSAESVRQRKELIKRNESFLLWQSWMEKIPADDYFRPQLEALAHNPDERTDAFGGDLLFGTGGLRAKIAPGTNRMNNLVAGRAAQGFANYLTKKYPGIERRVCVAYDTRECSKAFAGTVASVFAASGFRVFLYAEPRPTPMLSFAVRHFEAHAGVMITASHNPKQYNGFKAYNQTGGQLTDAASAEVEHEINRLDVFGVRRHLESQAADPANIIMLGKDFDDVYCEAVTKYLPRTDYAARHGDCLRLIYTPLFGTGATPVQALLERLGYNVHLVEEQSAPNGAFPGLRKPNPEEKEVFALAIEKAKTIRPDIIFATDPDADRIGVLAQNGDAYEVLSGSQTGALLAAYLIEAKAHSMQNPAIVTTIVTGTLAQRICEANGTAVALVLTGFKYIGERMDAWKADGSHTFLFGFEESFGYLVGDASRDKDAVITSALVAEMALWYKREKNQTLYEALQSLYQTYGPVSETLLELEAPEPNGQLLVEKIMRHARTNYAAFLPDETVVALEDYQSSVRHDLQSGTSEPLTLPVSNVIKLFFADGAWLVLRPSGTEPKIKLYICTNNAFGTGATLADAKTRCAILKVKLEITLNALLK